MFSSLRDLLYHFSAGSYFIGVGTAGWLFAGPIGLILAKYLRLVWLQVKIKQSRYASISIYYITVFIMCVPLALGFASNDYKLATLVVAVTWISNAICATGAPTSEFPVKEDTFNIAVLVMKLLLSFWLISFAILTQLDSTRGNETLIFSLIILGLLVLFINPKSIQEFRNRAFSIYDSVKDDMNINPST
jgi:hypothetical protein